MIPSIGFIIGFYVITRIYTEGKISDEGDGTGDDLGHGDFARRSSLCGDVSGAVAILILGRAGTRRVRANHRSMIAEIMTTISITMTAKINAKRMALSRTDRRFFPSVCIRTR